MRVSLIIPAHNEESRLAPTLHLYGRHLRERHGDDFEMIVVMNGCTDNTGREARSVAEACSMVKIIDVPEPIGKGGAILEGFRHAQGQRIAFADADGATAPDSLLKLIDQLDEHDVVIGSRYLPDSSITAKQPLARRVLSAAFAALVYLLFGLKYHDTQCGAKAFRRAAARRLAQIVGETRWVFDVDLILSAQALGLSIAEYPVVWADKPGSRIRVLATTRDVLRSLWSLWRRWRPAEQSGRSAAARPQRQATQNGDSAEPNNAVPSLRILALNWRCLRHPQCGGSEVNLFEQARRWVQAGHSVTVVCADPGPQFAPSRDERTDGVEVRRMGGRLTIYLFAALFLLRHAHEYDCILDISNGVPFFAPLFCRTPVTLLVHHVHDQQWFEEFPYPIAVLGRAIERHLVPLVYRDRPVIAVSPTTSEALIELGVAGSQIHIIYNGVNQPAPLRDPVQAQRHRIAYVGRIKHYKRLDRLVRAVADLRGAFPDVHLDIAGEGDARAEIEALIRQLGLGDNVTVHGPVDEQKKADILASAAVFATASSHEGWGISVIEANAYGCPAVAYDVPGLRVAICHDKTGLLASDDPDFERALALIMQDESLREKFSAAARDWAAAFDWGTSAQATLELLSVGRMSSVAQVPIQQLPDDGPEQRDVQAWQELGEPLAERKVGR